VTIVVLFVLLGAAAVYQLVLATRDRAPYPGPVSGTPFPTPAVTP
jgi:hypothetical protein